MNFATLVDAVAGRLLDPAFSGRLCLALAHSLWQMAALAAAAWGYERITRRRSVARCYGVYVAALAMGLIGACATFAVVESPIVAAASGDAAPMTSAQSPEIVDGELQEPASLAAAVRDAASVVPFGPPVNHSTSSTGDPVDVAALWLNIAPWTTAAYLAGVALMLARLARGIWSTQRLTREARVIADGPLVSTLRSLARHWSLRTAPRLAQAEHIVVPKVVGLVRPMILLPAAALTGLPQDELELILAHELAHVRRHDMWVNLLQRLAEAALFFNPALWLVSRRISALREYCCDELTCRTAVHDAASVVPPAACPANERRTRYAWALVHVAELARGAKGGAAYAELTALAASGRSPSELRRRVAHLFGEPLSEPVRLTRGGALTLVALAALLVAPAAWPSRTDSAAAAQKAGSEEASDGDAAKEQAVPINVVVARHVLLLEGREIITWADLDAKIAALPIPSLAHPSFYVTRGTRDAGFDDEAKQQIWQLHQKHQLQGHSEGSLWTQADFRYDHIENADDLVPNEGLRLDGVIRDKDGQPVAGAEVVLITPIDESIPYKTWHVTLVQGRLRNRLENELADSDAQGKFALYPPKEQPYYVVALHPDAGFALISSDDAAFHERREIKLAPWAGLVSQLAQEPGEDQEASIDTKVAARDGFPEMEFDQYWSEQKSELPAGFFGFTHVPPIFQTALSRSFQESDGGAVSVPGASASLLPGEIRRLDLGPLSDEQRKLLEAVREQFRQRSEQPAEDAEEENPDDNAAAERKPYEVPITVSGRALDEAGVPIAGAEIFLASPRTNAAPLAVVNTDSDGAYRFTNIPLPIEPAKANSDRDSGTFDVFGRAEGYGLAWRTIKAFYPDQRHSIALDPTAADQPTNYGTDDPIELDLRFGTPATLRGRIVNERGDPIPDARLSIRYADTEWDQDDYRGAVFVGSWLESLNERALVPPSVKTRVTDADGRFEFTNLAADCRWKIAVDPPGYTPRSIWAVTHPRIDKDAHGNPVHSGDFEVVFPRPRRLKLMIVEGNTGKPASKVGIGGKGNVAGFWETTGDDGLVEAMLPDGHYELSISPRYGTPYLWTDVEIDVSAEIADKAQVLVLRPAAVVEATVVDADTGAPLAGVDVWVERELEPGRKFREVHGYRSWEVETRISHFEQPRSDADGKMRILFEPGRTRFGVGTEAFPEGYAPVEPDGQELDLQPGEPTQVAFEMRRRRPAANAARGEDAADAFDDRFVVCNVQTDLERRLLGEREAPADEASVCVFVNNRAFADEEPIDENSRPFLLLKAWLEARAKIDDRLMVFRLQDEVDQGGIERVRQRGQLLEKFCRELAVKAGFQRVNASMTYGVDWEPSLARARAAVGKTFADNEPPRVVRSSVGNERVRVYAVRTLLERMIVTADCYADVQPVLRKSDAADFPKTFLPDLKELIPQLGDLGRETLLLSVHYHRDLQDRIDEWVNDINGRKAFAKELGFEQCNMQMSQVADEDADGGDTP